MTLDFLKNKKYLNLTKYYKELRISKDLVNIGFDGSLTIRNEKFYLKLPKSELRIYTELIAAKLLQKLNIPHVEYHLVAFFDEAGLISKSFKHPESRYISGQQLLDEYRRSLIKVHDIMDMNNLETIWHAIEYHYSKIYSSQEVQAITETLMKELTTVFSFDITVDNIDRHQSNWIIEESDKGIHLTPIFDNEFMLDSYLDPESLDSFSLGVDYDDLANFTDTQETITKYLEYSSQDFVTKLSLMVTILNPQVFKECLAEVEHDIGCDIPDDIKTLLENSYRNHHSNLINLLHMSTTRK